MSAHPLSDGLLPFLRSWICFLYRRRKAGVDRIQYPELLEERLTAPLCCLSVVLGSLELSRFVVLDLGLELPEPLHKIWIE